MLALPIVFLLILITFRAAGGEDGSSQECCICQEKSVNPLVLPCMHTFCYLCIKGVAARQKRCALCRSPIPPELIEKPLVTNKEEIKSTIEESHDTEAHHWFYEAKSGGWWLYEQRTSSEIERAFSEEERKPVQLQIAGFSYIVDFEEMVQYRVDYPTRRRRIKRDVVKKENVKGMAGIYVSEVPSGRGQRPGRTQASDSLAEATDGHRRRDVVDGEESTTETSSSQALSRLVTGFPH